MALGISIKGPYAERRVLIIVLLHVIMLSVVMQNVILLRTVSPWEGLPGSNTLAYFIQDQKGLSRTNALA
jgi:hypothetical protein